MKNFSFKFFEKSQCVDVRSAVDEYAGSYILCCLDEGKLWVSGKSAGKKAAVTRDMLFIAGEKHLLYCDAERKILRLAKPVGADISSIDLGNVISFALELEEKGIAKPEEIMVVASANENNYTFLGYSFTECEPFEEKGLDFRCYDLSFLKRERERIRNLKELAAAEKKARKEMLNELGELKNSLNRFLGICSFKEFFELAKKEIIGQDDQLLLACSTVYRYLKALSRGECINENFIIAAPSGCGKTQFFRTIRHIINDLYDCELPIIQIDLSAFTEVGFKGRNATEILVEMVKAGSSSGEGICFLDEFDKKISPSITSDGSNFNLKLQGELLTIVEGSVNTLGRTDEGGGRITKKINTRKTLFVGLGAFQAIRDKKKEEGNRVNLGFAPEKDARTEVDAFVNVDYSDIIELGGSNELLGRFKQVINFQHLADEDYVRIVTEYAESLTNLPDNYCVEITKEGAMDFIRFSYSEMGIREMMRRVDETVRGDITNLMLDEDPEHHSVIVIKGYLKTELIKKAEIKKAAPADCIENEENGADESDEFIELEDDEDLPF